jgi:hypothetical protein
VGLGCGVSGLKGLGDSDWLETASFRRFLAEIWRFLAFWVSVTPLFGGGAKVFSAYIICFQQLSERRYNSDSWLGVRG